MSEHEKHMCDLAEDGNIEAMKSLARNPRWICKECGRSSNIEETLCEPIDLQMKRHLIVVVC